MKNKTYALKACAIIIFLIVVLTGCEGAVEGVSDIIDGIGNLIAFFLKVLVVIIIIGLLVGLVKMIFS